MNTIELYIFLDKYHHLLDMARVEAGLLLPDELLKEEEIKPIMGKPYKRKFFDALEPFNSIIRLLEDDLGKLYDSLEKN